MIIESNDKDRACWNMFDLEICTIVCVCFFFDRIHTHTRTYRQTKKKNKKERKRIIKQTKRYLKN